MCDWVDFGEPEQMGTNEGKRCNSYNFKAEIDDVEEDLRRCYYFSDLDDGLSVWSRTEIDWKAQHIVYTVSLHYNMLPLRIAGRNMKLHVARFLNRINSSSRLGVFVIHFPSGAIQFKVSKNIGARKKQKFLQQQDETISKRIRKDSLPVIQFMDLHISDILGVSNMSQQLLDRFCSKPQTSRKLPSIIQRISQYLQLAHTDFNQILESDRTTTTAAKEKLDIKALCKIQNAISEGIAEKRLHKSWNLTKFADYLQFVREPEEQEWIKLYYGETYTVSKAYNVSVYAMKNGLASHGPVTKLNLIRKTCINGCNEHANNEEYIYDYLNSLSCSQYIPTSAYCNQQDKSSFIVEEGQQSISLQKYLHYSGDFCSLHTKLYFLIEVAKGIRALSVRNVLYLNLKPSNIMINGKVNCYFTDMSWAVKLPPCSFSVPADSKHASRVGMSFPEQSYSIKTDVYLMGKLMLNLLLDENELPIDRKVRMLGAAYLAHQHSIPELNTCWQQMQDCLPSCIADQLMQLIRRCVRPDPDLRPSIEWVIAILTEVRLAVLYD